MAMSGFWVRRYLGEGERCSGSPGGERVTYRLELGVAADVVRPVLEGEGEVRVRPGATGAERHAGVEIRHTAPVCGHLLPGLIVERSGRGEAVPLLVAA